MNEEQFFARATRQANGCNEWQGATGSGNRRHLWFEGRYVAAPRLAWTFCVGPIPAGLSVLHRCDNPPCIDIDHLFLGTTADNMRDKASKGRNTPRRLTTEQVLEIRRTYQSGDGEVFARRYGVSRRTIRLVVRGDVYSWLPLDGAVA